MQRFPIREAVKAGCPALFKLIINREKLLWEMYSNQNSHRESMNKILDNLKSHWIAAFRCTKTLEVEIPEGAVWSSTLGCCYVPDEVKDLVNLHVINNGVSDYDKYFLFWESLGKKPYEIEEELVNV